MQTIRKGNKHLHEVKTKTNESQPQLLQCIQASTTLCNK